MRRNDKCRHFLKKTTAMLLAAVLCIPVVYTAGKEPVSACAATQAPGGLKTEIAYRQVTVSWDAVQGASYYALFLKRANGETVLIDNRVQGTSYVVPGLENGVSVGFAVKAYANREWSGWSSTAWARPEAVAVAPTNITTAQSDEQVTVSWDAVPGASVYAIFLKKPDGTVVLMHNRVTTNSYVVNGLAEGQRAGFVVKSYVNRQWSGWSGTTWMTVEKRSGIVNYGDVYSFKNESSGWFINCRSGQTANGTEINLYKYDLADPVTERFVIELIDRTTDTIRIAPVTNKTQYINVRRNGNALAEGMGICLWQSDGEEKLKIEWQPDGSFYIVLAYAPEYCIAAKSATAAQTTQTQLVVSKKNGSKEQLWRLCNQMGEPITKENMNDTKSDLLDKLVNKESVKIKYKSDVATIKLGDTWDNNKTLPSAPGKQCFEFGMSIWYSLYGRELATTYDTSSNLTHYKLIMLSGSNATLVYQKEKPSLETVKQMQNVVGKGDLIQMSYIKPGTSDWSRHTSIVYDVDSEGIAVIDANWDAKNTVKIHKLTWNDFYCRVKTGGISVYSAGQGIQ